MIVLRLVFLAQLLVMLSGWTILVATPVDFHTLALMFYLVIIAAVVLVYALWQAIRHPARRRWAVATAATPLLCLTTPFFLVWLNGGPIHPAVLVGLVIVSGVVACFILLARSEQWRDDGMFAKHHFNVGFLATLVALLVLYWIPIIGWLYAQDTVSLPRDIRERDQILRVVGIYYASVAGPALLLSLFTVLYAPIGLVRNPRGRIIHAGQLLIALLALASLTVGAFALGVAMINPG